MLRPDSVHRRARSVSPSAMAKHPSFSTFPNYSPTLPVSPRLDSLNVTQESLDELFLEVDKMESCTLSDLPAGFREGGRGRSNSQLRQELQPGGVDHQGDDEESGGGGDDEDGGEDQVTSRAIIEQDYHGFPIHLSSVRLIQP